MALTINPKITFNGREAREGILDPAFRRPIMTRIMRVRENMKAKEQIAFLGRINKVSRTDPGCGQGKQDKTVSMEEKFWDPKKIKIWVQQCEEDIEDTFFVWGTQNGVSRTDLTQNPQYWIEFILEIFIDAAGDDIMRMLFLSDTAIDDIGSGGTLTNASDIEHYDQLDGIWNQIFTGVTADTIPRHVIDENYGSFATGVVTITDVANLLEGAADDIDVGATTFTAQAGAAAAGDPVFQAAGTLEATALSLKRQINAHATASTVVVATIDTADPTKVNIKSLAAGVAGNAIVLTYTDNGAAVGATVSGAGTLEGGFEPSYESQDNLPDGIAKTIYRRVYEQADARLKTAENKVYLVTGSLFDNRAAEKEDLANSGLETGLRLQMDGQDFNEDRYRNIPVINMETVWDRHIRADFDDGSSYDIPHRVILTTIDNLVAGFDSVDAVNSFISWYDETEELTNLKGKYKTDVHVMRDFMTSVAY